MSRSRISRALFVLGAPTIVAGLLASAPAPEQTPVSGVFSLRYTQQQALPVSDAAGPVLLLNQSTGTNRNTGKSDYMAGAEVINREIAELTQGNGPHQGYITEIKGADSAVTRWQGHVTTTLGPDQKPATRFEGTWTKVSGTGTYDRVAGNGTYTGRMLSPTEYTVQWSGNIVLNRTASR
jgi:hypothetical protein